MTVRVNNEEEYLSVIKICRECRVTYGYAGHPFYQPPYGKWISHVGIVLERRIFHANSSAHLGVYKEEVSIEDLKTRLQIALL